MKTAIFIKKMSKTKEMHRADQRLYRLSHPISRPFTQGKYNHVVVSAIKQGSSIKQSFFIKEPETFIFVSDQYGNIQDWIECEGSLKGECDHEKALNNAGYKVVKGNKKTMSILYGNGENNEKI